MILKDDSYFLTNTFTYDFQFVGETYERRMGLKWIAHSLHGHKQYTETMHELSIRIAIPLLKNIMVQINNPQYDGNSEKKTLKLKQISNEEGKQ